MIKPPKDFGPKKQVSIQLTLDTILNNRCQNVPPISLVFGASMALSDTATYVLAPAASLLWKFRWPEPVTVTPAASLDYIEIAKVRGDSAIEVRLKPGSDRFEEINLLLHFVPRGKRDPGRTLALDPVIRSGGGPRV